jgi:S1-C subfamily serine protease
MLLKLTCPSCGRSEQTSDRVLGKEIRCPCGVTFRVLGPKKDVPAAPAPSQPRPRPAARESSAPQGQPQSRIQAASSQWSDERPVPGSRSESSPRQRSLPEPPRPAPVEKPAAGGLPPWAYGAFGGSAVLFVVLIVALVMALNSSSTPSSNSTRAEDRLASHLNPQPVERANDPPAVTAAPTTVDAQPLTVAAAPAATETSVSPSVTSKPVGTPLTTAQIVARCEPSVALIKGKVSSGTGFLVRFGVIATNAHVIEEEFVSNLEVRFPSAPAGNQGPVKAQLLYEDRKRDLAFLAVKSDLPVLRIAPSYSFVKGEDILVIGNPGLTEDVVLENALSRGVMSSKTVIEGMNYHQMNISINPGNSGGPVFDSLGRVIGVATLKSNKTEAMGFCIPIEDVKAAMTQVGTPRPELASRHRAVVAFKLLTVAGALYSIALEVRASILQGAPAGGSDANLLPSEEVQKLHEVVTALDEKHFSLVNGELPGLQSDPALNQTAQRGYQDLAANYQAMKKLYVNPNRLVDQYFSQIQNLKAQHLRLIEILQKDLNLEVPPRLLAALPPRAMAGQPPTVVAEFVPFQLQPRFLGPRPGMGPRGPILGGPQPPTMGDPLQAAREHRRQMQKQVQDMRKRMRGSRGGGP